MAPKPTATPPPPSPAVSSGAIQAHLIGGAKALQARLTVRPTALPALAVRAKPRAPDRGVQGGHLQKRQPSTLQRKGRPGVEAFKVSLPPKHGGQPLPEEVRAKMEAAFGADFSDVRIHVGREASSIGAIAYTWGTNIHFAPGYYDPHSLRGQKILGHELWHVVQQRSGRVRNPLGDGVAVVQDHVLEAEADRMGVKAALTPVRRQARR